MLAKSLQCIFVHIPKTAGQSVEDVFLRHLGLSWNESAQLLLRPNTNPQYGPPRLAHLLAREYTECGHIGLAEFQRYFKFAVVRDPWNRLLSEYRSAYQLRVSFRDWLLRDFPQPGWSDNYRHVMPQTKYLYDDDGKLLVDLIIRFENLEAEFEKVRDALQVRLPELTHRNRWQKRLWNSSKGLGQSLRWLLNVVRPNQKQQTKESAYDQEMQQFVKEYYQDDFARLGYSPELSVQPGESNTVQAT